MSYSIVIGNFVEANPDGIEILAAGASLNTIRLYGRIVFPFACVRRPVTQPDLERLVVEVRGG